MTRGRCSSLRLHRDGLAPSTFRRSPGAPVHHIKTGLAQAEHNESGLPPIADIKRTFRDFRVGP